MLTILPQKNFSQGYKSSRTTWLPDLLKNVTTLLFSTSTTLLKPRTIRITQALNYFHKYFFTFKNSLYANN